MMMTPIIQRWRLLLLLPLLIQLGLLLPLAVSFQPLAGVSPSIRQPWRHYCGSHLPPSAIRKPWSTLILAKGSREEDDDNNDDDDDDDDKEESINPNDLESPEERRKRMEMVRQIQKSFYGQDQVVKKTKDGDDSDDTASKGKGGATSQQLQRTTTTSVVSSNTILQNVPLWRVQWVELPGFQNLLNVHVAHYTHMFQAILAGPKPWYFGHIYLPDGSENLDNPDYHFVTGTSTTTATTEQQTTISDDDEATIDDNNNQTTTKTNNNNKATYTGTLMQVADARQLEDGRLALVVQALERFEVIDASQHEPYAIATVQLRPDAELALPFYVTAQQKSRELSDDFLNDEDAWGAACAAALETAEQLRDFECKPVSVESSTMGAVAPLVNYDTEIDLAKVFPSDAAVIKDQKERVAAAIENHLFSASPLPIPDNVNEIDEKRVAMLEHEVWVGVDTLVTLLNQLSSNPGEARVTPVPTQILGLLPRGDCQGENYTIPWPADFQLDQYASRLEDYAAAMSVGTFSKSPFVRYDYGNSALKKYPIMRRAQRMSFVVWILLENIGIVGEDGRGDVSRPISRQEILEFQSITERLEAAKSRLDAINDALRLMAKQG